MGQVESCETGRPVFDSKWSVVVVVGLLLQVWLSSMTPSNDFKLSQSQSHYICFYCHFMFVNMTLHQMHCRQWG